MTHERVKSDERRFEKAACAKTGYDFQTDDFGDGGGGCEGCVECDTDAHENAAEVGYFEVAAGTVDEDTANNSHEGLREENGEGKNAGAEGRCGEGGLEVEREVEFLGHIYLN